MEHVQSSKGAAQVRGLKPNEIVPYTITEEGKILGACEVIGGGKHNRSGARYEQLRAKAMILLLRSTALRISDVATFPKDAVSWDEEKQTWRIRVRTQKSGEPVFLPIPQNSKACSRCGPAAAERSDGLPLLLLEWCDITAEL